MPVVDPPEVVDPPPEVVDPVLEPELEPVEEDWPEGESLVLPPAPSRRQTTERNSNIRWRAATKLRNQTDNYSRQEFCKAGHPAHRCWRRRC